MNFAERDWPAEPSLHGERSLAVELSALRERTEATRAEAEKALSQARDATSHASELQRRSARARERAVGRVRRRLERLVEQSRLRQRNVVAFDALAARHRNGTADDACERGDLDRAA